MFRSKKKFKPIRDYPDTWDVAQAVDDGMPIFVRIRSPLKDAIGHPDYPYQIGVAVPLLNPTSNGLPTKEEAQSLGAIEDKLAETLTNSVLTIVITWKSMREFVFYEKEWKPEAIEAQVKLVNKEHSEHHLQFIMKHDPSWATFKSYLS
jgi:hypothetical protein